MRILANHDPPGQLLGESPGIQAVRDTVRRLLAHGVDGRRLPAILIRGETGTGKGRLARALHGTGPRAAGPLVEVNCATTLYREMNMSLWLEKAGAERAAPS